jgi:hypothetical protein
MVQATGGGGHPSADPGGGVKRSALPGRRPYKKYPSHDTVPLTNPMVQTTGGGGHPSADPGGGVQRCAPPGQGPS